MNNQDKFGPEYQIEIYDPKLGMTGFLVIDNTVLGPGKGGIRMTPNVSMEEVFRLARTMTWKNALAGIPFGGAKAGIRLSAGAREMDPVKLAKLKKDFLQSFARSLQGLIPARYIAGPDVNTGEQEMQAFAEAAGNWHAATGKPAEYCEQVPGKKEKKCGLPHELGSTGFGVAHATAIAAKLAGLEIRKARVGIHGFGNVGTFAARFLQEAGATVVAIANSSSTLYAQHGLDQHLLDKLLERKKSLNEYPGSAKQLPPENFWALPMDILIPASVTDVITDANKDEIQAKIIVEGGNIPMQDRIEDELFRKGILIVPDFVANAGGVISSYAEYSGLSPAKMFKLVEEKIKVSTTRVLTTSLKERRNPRVVALELAQQIVAAKINSNP